MRTPLAALLVLAACDPPPRTCGEAECAAQCGEPEDHWAPHERVGGAEPGTRNVLTEAEYAALEPVLADVRAGVRPWEDGAVSLCRGAAACGERLPADAGELPPGEYSVWADLRVPRIGGPGDWVAVFRQSCRRGVPHDGTIAETASADLVSEHALAFHAEGRPIRIGPLATVTSPDPEHRLSCAWELELRNPLRFDLLRGTYRVPHVSDLTPTGVLRSSLPEEGAAEAEPLPMDDAPAPPVEEGSTPAAGGAEEPATPPAAPPE